MSASKTKRSSVRIDHINQRIIIRPTFHKKAQNPNSYEARELMEIHSNYKDYAITVEGIRVVKPKNTYKGLTLENMKRYIMDVEPAEKANEVLEEMEKTVRDTQFRTNQYQLIRKWFLAKYPDVKDVCARIAELEENSHKEEEKQPCGKDAFEDRPAAA